MEQHTAEWWAARCGKVTASRIGDIMGRKQNGDFRAARANYLQEKVAERVTGKNRDRRKIASLDQRLDLEPDARAAYEFYTDTEIVLVGFVEHPRIPNFGCSPDGMVGTDGGVEIKCCDAETHIEVITAGSIDQDYLYQIHSNLACTDRLWWDYIGFNPDMPEEGKLYVKRIKRDESLIATIEQAVIEFNEEVDRKVEQTLAVINGSSALEAALKGSLSALHVVH